MGRDISQSREPCGVCDACGRYCWVSLHVNIECFFCHAGQFRNAGLWMFLQCPACKGACCDDCHLWGRIAAPLEQPRGYGSMGSINCDPWLRTFPTDLLTGF